jgi:hypothetical protein
VEAAHEALANGGVLVYRYVFRPVSRVASENHDRSSGPTHEWFWNHFENE